MKIMIVIHLNKMKFYLINQLYLGFSVLELSKLHMYETYYDKFQPYFGQENLQLHYIDTDSFVLSVNTKNIIQDLHNLKEYFDFSNLNKDHELFSDENKKVLGKFKIETPKNIFIDEFLSLDQKHIHFKCNNNDENKNKLKGFVNLRQKILNLKNIILVYLEKNIKKNVKII